METISKISVGILTTITQTILILGFLAIIILSCMGVAFTDWFQDLKDLINTRTHVDSIELLMAFGILYAGWVFLYFMIVGFFRNMRDITLLLFSIWHFGLPLALVIIFSNVY